jgi:hypothetical protein
MEVIMANIIAAGIKTFEENFVTETANPVKKVIARLFVRMMFITACRFLRRYSLTYFNSNTKFTIY